MYNLLLCLYFQVPLEFVDSKIKIKFNYSVFIKTTEKE